MDHQSQLNSQFQLTKDFTILMKLRMSLTCTTAVLRLFWNILWINSYKTLTTKSHSEAEPQELLWWTLTLWLSNRKIVITITFTFNLSAMIKLNLSKSWELNWEVWSITHNLEDYSTNLPVLIPKEFMNLISLQSPKLELGPQTNSKAWDTEKLIKLKTWPLTTTRWSLLKLTLLLL